MREKIEKQSLEIEELKKKFEKQKKIIDVVESEEEIVEEAKNHQNATP